MRPVMPHDGPCPRRRAASAGCGQRGSARQAELAELRAQLIGQEEALRRSGELGLQLVTTVRELASSRSVLESEVSVLHLHNRQLTAKVGNLCSEKRELSEASHRLVDDLCCRDLAMERLAAETGELRSALQSAAAARLHRPPSALSDASFVTPRGLLRTPRDALAQSPGPRARSAGPASLGRCSPGVQSVSVRGASRGRPPPAPSPTESAAATTAADYPSDGAVQPGSAAGEFAAVALPSPSSSPPPSASCASPPPPADPVPTLAEELAKSQVDLAQLLCAPPPEPPAAPAPGTDPLPEPPASPTTATPETAPQCTPPAAPASRPPPATPPRASPPERSPWRPPPAPHVQSGCFVDSDGSSDSSSPSTGGRVRRPPGARLHANVIRVEDYCSPTPGAPSPRGLPRAPSGRAGSQGAAAELSAWGADGQTVEAVTPLTAVEGVPLLEHLEEEARSVAAEAPCGGGAHRTLAGLGCIARRAQQELLRLDFDDAQRRRRAELRRLERDLGVVAQRVAAHLQGGPLANECYVAALGRDYQRLRALEGDLLLLLHAAQTPGDRDACRYQAALVRQQKVVLRQKASILRSPGLRDFYNHFTVLLSALLLLLRGLRFSCPRLRETAPGDPPLPPGAEGLLDFLLELLPAAGALWSAPRSCAHLRPPAAAAQAYTAYALAEVDDCVDALALSLCRMYEQQLTMLSTEGDSVWSSGTRGVADWAAAVVLEGVRQQALDPALPAADQLAALIQGERLTWQGVKRPRFAARSAPIVPGAAVMKHIVAPPQGRVPTAPPSEHLGWTAEGVLRYCGVRTFHEELFGHVGFDREVSYHHYGFRTSTAHHARDLGMEPVRTLAWQALPGQEWQDDEAFVAFSPVLFQHPYPCVASLLALHRPALAPGGYLTTPCCAAPPQPQPERTPPTPAAAAAAPEAVSPQRGKGPLSSLRRITSGRRKR